jgi:hypothetical protein
MYWIRRTIGALAMVVVVHAFILIFKVPKPDAWYVGAMIYTGLVAVLFSTKSLYDKLGIYLVFLVVTIVGAVTVCPCTGAHFVLAPIAGFVALGVVHLFKP